MECRQKRTRQIAIVLLIVFAVLFMFSATTELSYAAGNETYLSDEYTPLAKNNEGFKVDNTPNFNEEAEDENYKKNAKAMKEILGLDIEDVGVLSKARHAVAVGLSTVASILFSLQVNLTYIVTIFLNWSQNLPWLDSLAEAIGTFIQENLGMKFFSFGGGNNIILLVIFFAMCGIALSLAQMRVSEGFGKAAKMIILIAIAMALTTQSVTVYKTINDTAIDLENVMVKSLTNGKSLPQQIWDINAIRPWKVLEFGDYALSGTAFVETKKGSKTNNAEARTTADDDDGSETWNYDDTIINPRWTRMKKDSSNTVNDIKGMIGPLDSYYFDTAKIGKSNKKVKTNGSVIFIFLAASDGSREEIASVLTNHGFGMFKLSASVQGARCAMAFIMFLLSLPLTGFTLLIALILIALKLVAMLLFFLWPIILLIAIATNSMDMVRKWITTVAIIFLSCVVIEFVFSLIISIVLGIFSSYMSFGNWCLASILVMALFIAAFIGYPHFMNIIGARGQHLPGQNKMERLIQSQIMANTFGKRMGEAMSNAAGGNSQSANGVSGHGDGGEAVGQMQDPTEMTDDQLEQEMAAIDDDTNESFGEPLGDFDEDDLQTDDTVDGMGDVPEGDFDDNGEIDSDDVGVSEDMDNPSAESDVAAMDSASEDDSEFGGTGDMDTAKEPEDGVAGAPMDTETAKAEAGVTKSKAEEERIAAENAAKLSGESQAVGSGAEVESEAYVGGGSTPSSERPEKNTPDKIAAVGATMGSAAAASGVKNQTSAAMAERRKSPAYKAEVKKELERRKRENAKRAAEMRKETAKANKKHAKEQKKQAVKNVVAEPARATKNLAKTATNEKLVKPVKTGVDNRIVKPVKTGVQNKVVDPFNKRVAKPIQKKSQSMTDSINSFSDRIKK